MFSINFRGYIMPRDSVNTEQYLVIRNLNNYLKYHNLPIKVNEDGICHALSTLYIQYKLDGKEQEFERLLSIIAQKTAVEGSVDDAKIFALVTEIIALHSGKGTRNQYNQSNCHEQLFVEGQSLKSLFQIGLATNLENWARIVSDISLRQNEVMRVTTLDHTIAIARDKDGGYNVYDPNNSKINQKFDNEKEMVQWLSKEAFNFSLVSSGSDKLDMNISVISHQPSPDERNFPDKINLLEQYLTPEQKRLDPKLGGGLHFAMKFDDAEAARYILNSPENEFTEKEIQRIALCAIYRDSANALGELIEKMRKEDKMVWLDPILPLVLSSGSHRCFQELLKTEHMKTLYNDLIVSNQYPEILKRAFTGMNEQLIDKVMTDVADKRGKNAFTSELISELIEISVEKQNSYAIGLLSGKIDQLDKQIGKEKCLELVKKAIENNDPLMVSALITHLHISKEELNCLNMGVSVINKYNVRIFAILEDKGYNFTPQAKDLIESKKAQSIGILKTLGIALIRFSEFLTNQNKIQVDRDKVNEFSPNIPKSQEPQVILATDDETDDEELKSDAQSLKQNVPVFKEFKEKFHSIISSLRETETNTKTDETSFNAAP